MDCFSLLLWNMLSFWQQWFCLFAFYLLVWGFSFSATRLVYYLKRYILHAEYLRESVEDEFPFSHDILLIIIKIWLHVSGFYHPYFTLQLLRGVMCTAMSKCFISALLIWDLLLWCDLSDCHQNGIFPFWLENWIKQEAAKQLLVNVSDQHTLLVNSLQIKQYSM